MKAPCFISVLLMVAVPASAQLRLPAADQLQDYEPWLSRFDPSSHNIVPDLQIPANTPIYKYGIREWTTWEPLSSPFFPRGQYPTSSIQTEIVFIGQTGDQWGRFGYVFSGEKIVLSESADDRQFGSNATVVFKEPVERDFFVEAPDGKPYDATSASARWYYGMLQPLSSVHDLYPDERLDTMNPYYVFAIEIPAIDAESSRSLFIFGVNAFDQNLLPIPEPGTYGLAGAAALLALVAWRRFRTRHLAKASPLS